MRLANRAAGIVVGKLGTAVVHPRRTDSETEGPSCTTVVTGAAGFIGANLVKALNERGITDIIAVDNLTKADKFSNLVDCEIADYLDKDEFLERLEAGDFDGDIEAIFHQGACSDTMETDGRYMMENNYRYSLALLDYCLDQEVPFLYASSASVYGGGTRVPRGARASRRRSTSTAIRSSCSTRSCAGACRMRSSQIVGFRYFNVYGPREQHKGRMASVAFHFFNQYQAERQGASCSKAATATATASSGAISSSSTTWSRSICISSTTRSESGIFNLGTGRAQTFNDVAVATVNACRQARGEAAACRWQEMREQGRDRVHPVSGGPQGQVPELYPGRPAAAARRRLRSAVPRRELRRRALR